MAMDPGLACVMIIFYIFFYACLKIYVNTHSEEESPEQTDRNPQNQPVVRQNNVITTGPTVNTQSYWYGNTNNDDAEFANSLLQLNRTNPPIPPVTPRSPQLPSAPPQPARNLTEQFDSPPSYDDAMKHISQGQNQEANRHAQ